MQTTLLPPAPRTARRRASASFARATLALLLAAGLPAAGQAQDEATLKSFYAATQDRLANNPFGRPLFIESKETSGHLQGNVYSLIEHPYAMVSQALRPATNWCDILMLHLNVKGCRTTGAGPTARLWLAVGKKHDQPIEDAYRLDFGFRVNPAAGDYFQVQLNADDGPLGTRDYRIRLEAVPIDGHRTFIHMSYSYAYGMAARLAMQAYLATLGRDKVGFSVTGKQPDGRPALVGGVLGVVERNTMRYYLAIDTFLANYGSPAAEQPERRIHQWHAMTERYATQLHEMTRPEYIDMKRKELQRQKAEAR